MFNIELRDNGVGTFDISLASGAVETFVPWVMIF